MKKTILIFLLGILFKQVQGQCSIYFTYDNAGNRIKRYYCTFSQKEQLPAATEVTDSQPRESQSSIHSDEIHFSPNPTTSLLQVRGWEHIEKQRIEVFSSDGKQILQLHLQNNELDVSDLPSGLYFIRYRLYGENLVSKIIKTN